LKFACLIFVLAALMATPASAQYWVTKDACDLTGVADHQPVISDQVKAQAAAMENDVGRLWRITAPSGGVSHLWGTIHSAAPELLALPDKLMTALKNADAVAVELTGVAANRGELRRNRTQEWKFEFRQAETAYSFLDKRVDNWARSRLVALGYDRKSLSYFSFAGLAGTLLSEPCNDFSAWVIPIQDSFIQTLGLSFGAQVVGLEENEAFQKALVKKDKQGVAKAVIELYGAALNPEGYKAGGPDYAALYLNGQISQMMALEREWLSEFYGPEKAERLLTLVNGYLLAERNHNFVKSAVPLLDQGGAVLAVGCYHLPGKFGLVRLFRNAGYQVERVRTESEVE
jgi:uncharacterized protein YbaP (TraB family)